MDAYCETVSFLVYGEGCAVAFNLFTPFRLEVWEPVENILDCGLEFHYKPMVGEPYDFEFCHILKGPCCHDGTTLYAREAIAPIYRECSQFGDYTALYQKLVSELERACQTHFPERFKVK